ncbi:hypothetical protein MP638_003052 [Amoeboaphelidium occidentale]|nr:hypothetical protein MP638_003052 [Amoeboaphelidium occidentale]
MKLLLILASISLTQVLINAAVVVNAGLMSTGSRPATARRAAKKQDIRVLTSIDSGLRKQGISNPTHEQVLKARKIYYFQPIIAAEYKAMSRKPHGLDNGADDLVETTSEPNDVVLSDFYSQIIKQQELSLQNDVEPEAGVKTAITRVYRVFDPAFLQWRSYFEIDKTVLYRIVVSNELDQQTSCFGCTRRWPKVIMTVKDGDRDCFTYNFRVYPEIERRRNHALKLRMFPKKKSCRFQNVKVDFSVKHPEKKGELKTLVSYSYRRDENV